MKGVHKRKRAGGSYVYEIVFDFEGKPVTETVGKDERFAARLLNQRRRQVAAGSYARPGKCTGSSTIRDYTAQWFEKRENGNKMTDAQLMRDHILPKVEGLRLKDVTVETAITLIKSLVADDQTISLKTARNAYGVFRTMMKQVAERFRLIPYDPCTGVPLDTWPTDAEMGDRGKQDREAYPRDEAWRLMTDERLAPGVRILIAIWFFTATREGEGCGLTWRQWTRDAAPLGSLAIDWQYDHKPLKGERRGAREKPRKVPVHPVLAEMLTWWWEEGFALTYLRAPMLDDFIVPKLAAGRWNKVRTLGGKSQCHTKSSAGKLFVRACAAIGVTNRTLHGTRHTWVTGARRALARDTLMPALDVITHNPKGKIIDQYTHWEWEPLCEVVLGVSYAPAAPAAPPVGAPLPPPMAPISVSVFDGLNEVTGQGSRVGFHVASAASSGMIDKFGGGAGNRTRPTNPECSRKAVDFRVEHPSGDPSNSREFMHVDVSANPQHGDAASAARNYLVAGSDGEPCAHLALQLAAAVMSSPVVRLAITVLGGGPHTCSRATELASLVLAPARADASLSRPLVSGAVAQRWHAAEATPLTGGDALTRRQVAELLGISIYMVSRLIRDEGLPGLRLGSQEYRFLRSEVAAWLASRRVEPDVAIGGAA